MMPKLLSISFALMIALSACSPPLWASTAGSSHGGRIDGELPVWMTPEEMRKQDEIGTYAQPTAPPPTQVRCTAEFEKRLGVLFTWSFGSWQHIYLDMVEALQDQVICFIVTTSESSVRSAIQNAGLPLTNIQFINESTNSVWTRDYGPWCIIHEDGSPGIADFEYNRPRPLDDAIPQKIAAEWGIPCYTTDLRHAGGNFSVDGMGVCFASSLVDDENGYGYSEISQIFEEYTGCESFHMLDRTQVEYTGHIDMYFKLLDPFTMMIGEYDDPGGNDYYTIENNVDDLRALTNPGGRPYRIRRIPQPDVYGYWDVVRAYTNSLIVNDKVLLPTYNTGLDDIAIQVYEDLLPGYTIHPINCADIIESGGAIHCITMGVADPELISIEHIPFLDEPPHPGNGYAITAWVEPADGNSLTGVSAFWSLTEEGPFQEIPMVPDGDAWTALLPLQDDGTGIYYHIEANDDAGNTNIHPYGAPANNHFFTCGQDIAVHLEPDDTFLHPGETLQYKIHIYNLTDAPQAIAGRGEVFFQNGNPYPRNPVIGPVDITLPPGAHVERWVSHPLPPNTPDQLYYYKVFVEKDDGTHQAMEWFHFLVQ